MENNTRSEVKINNILDGIYSEVCNRHNIDYNRVETILNSVASGLNIDGERCSNEAEVIAKLAATA